VIPPETLRRGVAVDPPLIFCQWSVLF